MVVVTIHVGKEVPLVLPQDLVYDDKRVAVDAGDEAWCPGA